MTFNTRVVETEWLEEEGRWRVLTSGGAEYYSQVLVHATGMLHHPAYPGLAGQQDFTGQTLHTARWDQDINLTGKVGHQSQYSHSTVTVQISSLHRYQIISKRQLWEGWG